MDKTPEELARIRAGNFALKATAVKGLRAVAFHAFPPPDDVRRYQAVEARGERAWNLWFWRDGIEFWACIPLDDISRSAASYFLSYIGDYQMYDYLDEAALARGHYVYEPYPGDPAAETDALRSLYPSAS